jgi:hypothetical protein
MNGSWQAEDAHLRFRWSEIGEFAPYHPDWMEEASNGREPSRQASTGSTPLPNFAAHSPLGSGEWFVPWDARWCVPGKLGW